MRSQRSEVSTMVKRKRALIALVGIGLLLGSCVPLFNLWIQGTWEVDEYYRNGEEQTASFYLLFGNYVITMHPDGAFTETYMLSNILPVTNTGTWEFIGNGRQLSLVDQSATRIFDVKSLTKAEIRLYRTLGEGEYEELVLEPKAQE